MTSIPFKRPLGVTIRGLLYLVEGIVTILCGVLISITTQYIKNYMNNFPENNEISVFLKILDSNFSYVLVTWLIVAGSAGIIIGFGILKGRRWAWKITIFQTLLSVSAGIIYFLFSSTSELTSKIIGTLFELIVGAVIIYYFYRPSVISYFNRISR
jgi:hypothetical protein